MEPTTAAILAGGSVLAAAAAPRQSAPVMGGDAWFDHSGWNIAFPGASITATRSENDGAAAIDAQTKTYLMYFGIAAGAILLWKLVKKS